MSDQQCEACSAAWGDIGSDCADRHTPAVLKLAAEIASECGQHNPTLQQIGWFADDAEAAVAILDECESWEVNMALESVRLPDGYAPIMVVNGVKFVCADGPMFLYDPANYDDPYTEASPDA